MLLQSNRRKLSYFILLNLLDFLDFIGPVAHFSLPLRLVGRGTGALVAVLPLDVDTEFAFFIVAAAEGGKFLGKSTDVGL